MNTKRYITWLATAAFTILVASLAAQPCSSINSEIRDRNNTFAVNADSEEANLDLFRLTGTVFSFPVSGTLEDTPEQLKSVRTYRQRTGDAGQRNCESKVESNAPNPVDVIRFVPDRNARVRFTRGNPNNVNDISITLFQDAFIPSNDNCGNFITSSLTSPTAGNLAFIEADLIAARTYFLVVLTGRTPRAPYPRPYSISASSSEVLPTFYTGDPIAADYAYTYLAVDDTDGIIDAVSASGSFRDMLTEGTYSIYGINYRSSDGTDFLQGSDLEEIQMESDGSQSCLQLSTNFNTLIVAAAVAAPVDWLTFRAEVSKQATQLYWDVASETDNDYFRIERSAGGADWAYLDDVAGNGTTQAYAAFTYTDAAPLTGRSYYRLVQVDFDGSEHPSAVVEAVRLLAAAPTNLTTYPNPFANSITVSAGAEITGLPRVYDVRDREVTGSLTITRSSNEASITTGELPAGVYLIRWADQQVRVVKQ